MNKFLVASFVFLLVCFETYTANEESDAAKVLDPKKAAIEEKIVLLKDAEKRVRQAVESHSQATTRFVEIGIDNEFCFAFTFIARSITQKKLKLIADETGIPGVAVAGEQLALQQSAADRGGHVDLKPADRRFSEIFSDYERQLYKEMGLVSSKP